ncbi:MAG TPA: hypothetical protein VHQ89_12715 [Gaiellaceae bacterium]|nr:hypothetical protein [Gaiellaceae bacterium]
MTRRPDALRWTTVGMLAVVALVCSVLPAVHLELSGFIGAGETQRVYHVQRDVAFVPDLLSHSLVIVLPALALLGTAVAGFVYGSRRWVAVIAFVAGLTIAVACFRVETHFTFIEQGAVIGCDMPCAGFVLLPAVRGLQDDLLSTPAGQQPGFELTGGENGYYAKPLDAWWGMLASGLMLSLLGGYAVARLATSPWRASAFVAAGAVAVIIVLFLQALGRME